MITIFNLYPVCFYSIGFSELLLTQLFYRAFLVVIQHGSLGEKWHKYSQNHRSIVQVHPACFQYKYNLNPR